MINKRCRLIPIFFLSHILIFAQQKNSNDYYSRLTLKNYTKDSQFNESIDFDHIDITRLDAAVFFVANEQRAKYKLPLLAFAPELEKMALMHSKDMFEENFFSHENPSNKKKKTPDDRAGLVGIINPYIAENIAQVFGLQYTSNSDVAFRGPGKFSYKPDGNLIPPHTYLSFAQMVVNYWMHSSGHRRNILSKDAIQLGCGAYFYRNKSFNEMPVFNVTQNFQCFESIKSTM